MLVDAVIMASIYDKIGKEYDTTRKVDPQILSTLASLLDVEDGQRYLDIACGTGNYAIELAASGGKWFAFDHSEKMLAQARSKSTLIDWRQYDVAQLGYEDNFFDAAICTLAIHHFPDLDIAFREIARVLKPDGKLVIFTATPAQMKGYWLNRYFPQMMAGSCEEMPAFDAIRETLSRVNFSIESIQPFFIGPDLQDFFLYSGKQRPEMYLSSRVRNGISSFHKFCSDTELTRGLDQLRKDIDSGTIKGNMQKYESEIGDYLFVSALKGVGDK